MELAKLGANVTLIGRDEPALMQGLIDLSFISKAEQHHAGVLRPQERSAHDAVGRKPGFFRQRDNLSAR